MEQQPTTARTGLKFGIIVGVIMMVFSTIINVTDLMTSPIANIIYLILLGGIIWAIYEFRKTNQGFIFYGEGLGIGTFVGAISGFLSAVFSYIYVEFIDPTLMDRIKELTRLKMEDQGLADDQIEKTIEIQAMIFGNPTWIFLGTVVWFGLLGFLMSLIISAIMKKDKPFELE